MALSFDCSAQSLLCGEDDISIIFEDSDRGVVDESGAAWQEQNHRPISQNKRFNGGELFIELPLHSEECLGSMVEKECQHLPNESYLKRLRSGELDLGIRKVAIDWIKKAHAYYSFGPLSAYLSVNYLDRFLSVYELPRGKDWMMQLLAVACLSLAAKIEETEVPLSVDFQVGESKWVFEARTIQRMELLLLTTLKWRMQAVTPFSFIDHFLRKINDNQPPSRSLISRSIQLTIDTTRGIDFLEFRPSEIAAALAIYVLGEIQTVDNEKALSCLIPHVEKERVLKCLELIQNVFVISDSVKFGASPSVASVPQSPIGVLDAACFSYKSDDLTVGSCVNSSHNSPETKRRKLD